MLLHNTREALGHEFTVQVEALSKRALSEASPATYSDGRMAPWEWILTEDRLVKVDASDETVDHTLIGRQSILWDLAALCVEWNLPEDQAKWLTQQVGRELSVNLGALKFYLAAWCAFRLGLLSFSQHTGSAGELSRLQSRISELRELLAQVLADSSTEAANPGMLHHT
jgi:hypothetical protein